VRVRVRRDLSRVQASAKSMKGAKGPAKVLVVDKRMKKDKRGKTTSEKRKKRK